MKKINNKFHNNGNNNNTIYSLNYKFDSVCSAGKFSGTALDLIKKYNELAKEAHSNGNYVEMEVFRQYAEHYRKIVTEINERKNQQRDSQRSNQNDAPKEENVNDATENTSENGLVETQARETVVENSSDNSNENAVKAEAVKNEEKAKPQRRRRSFTIVEVSANEAQSLEEAANQAEEKVKRRRTITRAKKSNSGETEA